MTLAIFLAIVAIAVASYAASQISRLQDEQRQLRNYVQTLHEYMRQEWLSRASDKETKSDATADDEPPLPEADTPPVVTPPTTSPPPTREVLESLMVPPPADAPSLEDIGAVPIPDDDADLPDEEVSDEFMADVNEPDADSPTDAVAEEAVVSAAPDQSESVYSGPADRARKRNLLHNVAHEETSEDAENKSRRGWEEQLGVRLPVWIGAIAFFLAGAFLVKYTFDKGLLSPPIRVGMGVAFGVALLGVGEWMRKRDRRIAQGLSAAGVGDLYASFLAATNLYELVTPTVGFLLLAATTGLAIFLSLRHGPFVALLGLIGGFVTPALIGSEEPDATRLFGYLILLQIGLLVVSRQRQWFPLGALTMIGGFAWVILWLVTSFTPTDSTVLVMFLIGSIGAFISAARNAEGIPHANRWFASAFGQPAALVGAAIGVVLLCVVIGKGEHTPQDWAFFGLLGAGAIVLGRLNRRYERFPFITALASVLLLIIWGRGLVPADVPVFRWVALGVGAVYAVGGYLAQRGAKRPVIWAGLSSAVAIIFFVSAYWFTEDVAIAPPWFAISLGLAVLYVIGAVPLYRARESRKVNAALGAVCVAATFFVSLALPLEVDRKWLGVSWSLEAAALMYLAGWLSLPLLRVLASAVAVVGLSMLVQPGVLAYEFNAHPIFNWILVAYGLSAAAFAVAAWLAARQAAAQTSESFQIGTLILVIVGVALLIRHGFHPTDIRARSLPVMEFTSYCIAALSLAIAAGLIVRRAALRVPTVAMPILAVTGTAACVIGMLTAYNPIFREIDIGTTLVFNKLLVYLGIPALLAGFAVALYPRAGRTQDRNVLVYGLCLLSFLLVGYEVRHAFHPADMQTRAAGNIEATSYLCAAIIVAAIWFAVGAKRFAQPARVFANVLLLASAVAAIFVLGLYKNPLLSNDPIGTTLIFNRILFLYAVPTVLLFGVLIWHGDKIESARFNFITAVALGLIVLLVGLEIRHGFHPEEMGLRSVTLVETTTYIIALTLLASLWLLVTTPRFAQAFQLAGHGLFLTVTIGAVAFLLFVKNPLMVHESVGQTKLLNKLPYVYAAPALIIAAAGWLQRRKFDAQIAAFVQVVALLLAFAFVSFEVRQWFQGEFLDGPRPENSEMYAYSAVWIVFGAVLLAAGIATRSLMLRWASLLVMLVTVFKVFLLDTSQLQDLYRVLSLFGLGVSLMVLAFVYQRFVFSRKADDAPEVDSAEQPA